MLFKLEAHMQQCPNSGYVAWIENTKTFNMVVQGETPEDVTRELVKSLKVSISYVFGADFNDIVDTEIGEDMYLQLISGFQESGKKELKLQLASA